MVKYFFQFLELLVRGMIVFISLFLLLCMNVFTIPIFIILWLFCKLFRLRTPHWGGYGFMVYPTWSNKPHKKMMDDLREIKKKEDKKVRKYKLIRAWEERFF